MGKKSESKFIPETYKFARLGDREALLQGLLDTDGYVSPADNNIEYTTVSRQLAEDVVFLVQSLGGTARIREKHTTGQLAYRMSIALPDGVHPFWLERKARVYHPRQKYQPTRAIVAVEPEGDAEMVCIAVDAPDCCYVIDHCIVTHNTFMQLEWARLLGQRTLIVAPLSVARQTVREAMKIGQIIHYTRSGDDLIDGTNITNYEMLEHFDPSAFGAVVLDECFPPDTPIDVLNIDKSLELRYISEVREGDTIYNAQGEDHVKAVYKRRINRAVRITVNGRDITCSENHPFFTLHGWRCAQDLRPADYIMETGTAVRLVREGVCPNVGGQVATILRDILLSEMENEHAGAQGESAYPGRTQESGIGDITLAQERRSEGKAGNGADHESQSRVQAGGTGESVIKIASDGAQTFRTLGEWKRFNGPATEFVDSLGTAG